jgi:hypothetical protein
MMRGITNYFHSMTGKLTIPCNVNVHITWVSTGTILGGDILIDHLVNSGLIIFNQGNESTFIITKRK